MTMNSRNGLQMYCSKVSECIKSVRLQLIEEDWQVSNKLEPV
jgi:hypothetical protein